VKKIATKNGATEFKVLTNENDCAALWRARKECLWSAMSTYPDKDVMITDVAVPLSKLPDMMRRTREILNSTKVKYPSPIVAHAGDGKYH
jgi:D-lactate dehydrogenase (cytochrome)